MKAMMCRHRASLIVFAALVAVLFGIGFEVGLTRFLVGTATVLRFLSDQAVTIVFLLVVGSLVMWMLRLHFSSDQAYRNFDLKKLVSYPDGSPDPKKISLWLATAMGTYAFFYLLMHDRLTFASFGIWFLGVLFGYAGLIEVFGKKEPLLPGTVKIKDTNVHTREVTGTDSHAGQEIGSSDLPKGKLA